MPDIFDASVDKPQVRAAQPEPEIKVEPVSEPKSVSEPEPAPIPELPSETTPSSAAEPTSEPPMSETSNSHQDTSHRLTRDVDEYSQVMRKEHASNNALLAFVPKPNKIFFDSQHQDERVLLLLRRHPVTQLPWIFISILLSLAPFLFADVGLLDFLPLNYQVAAAVGWYMLIFGFALQSFLSWFYNVFIITDERIIDVDFHNLLYKNISAAKIDNIEDITTVAQGVISSIFNYGTVKVQTSAAVTEFEFEDVPQPAKVAAFLNEMLIEEEREKNENRTN